MDKLTAYRIMPEARLVLEFFGGPVTFADYINLKIEQLEDAAFDISYNFIVDIRHLEVVADKSDLKRIIEYFENNRQLVSGRLSALLTATPEQVVFSTLFKNYSDKLPMRYKVVSTLQAAVKWVNLSFEHYPEIEKELNEMRSESSAES